MKLFIFGNGNLSFTDFQQHYQAHLEKLDFGPDQQFMLGEFRGADTLAMEFLKDKSAQVTVLHMMERPRYLPDKYKTKVSQWRVQGGYQSDAERDAAAIAWCTHFLGIDFNSNAKRVSGTQKNIERCRELGKVELGI